MRSNSAEEPRWVQKEPIKNRSSKNAQYVSHGFIGRPVHPVNTGPCDRRVRRLRLPETTQDLPRYRARDPSRRALGCFSGVASDTPSAVMGSPPANLSKNQGSKATQPDSAKRTSRPSFAALVKITASARRSLRRRPRDLSVATRKLIPVQTAVRFSLPGTKPIPYR
jgi:hypothetical protein